MTNDPFAQRNSVPAVSWKDAPIGTRKTLRILQDPEDAQQTDFDTGEPAKYPDGNPRMAVVTRVHDLDLDEERALWVKRPSAMFSAVADAQVRAGRRIQVGGVLEITYIGEKPSDTARKNPTKLYTAAYTPPDAFGVVPPSTPPSWPQGAAQTAYAPPPVYAPQAPAYAPPPPGQYAIPAAQMIPVGAERASAPVPPPPVPASPGPAPMPGPPPLSPPPPAPPLVPAPTPAPGPSPEQIAAVKAAGLDPLVIFGGNSQFPY